MMLHCKIKTSSDLQLKKIFGKGRWGEDSKEVFLAIFGFALKKLTSLLIFQAVRMEFLEMGESVQS